MSPLFYVLLISLAVIAALFCLLMALADKLDAARRRSAPIATIRAVTLPSAVCRPAAWRRRRR